MKKNFLDTKFNIPNKKWKKDVSSCKVKYLRIDSDPFTNTNFNQILMFIGKYCRLTNQIVIGDFTSSDTIVQLSNAYKVIRHQVKAYSLQISSRELSSLRKSYIPFSRILKRESVLKIPYKISVIFCAIFDIIQKIETTTEKIRPTLGESQSTFRDCLCQYYYDKYNALYLINHGNWESSTSKVDHLNYLLFNQFNDNALNCIYQKKEFKNVSRI